MYIYIYLYILLYIIYVMLYIYAYIYIYIHTWLFVCVCVLTSCVLFVVRCVLLWPRRVPPCPPVARSPQKDIDMLYRLCCCLLGLVLFFLDGGGDWEYGGEALAEVFRQIAAQVWSNILQLFICCLVEVEAIYYTITIYIYSKRKQAYKQAYIQEQRQDSSRKASKRKQTKHNSLKHKHKQTIMYVYIYICMHKYIT